ncbi:MAG: VOC family protein [Betaproteobacteria bacterium]|nr:VOC family protein [Betaproteobacteria bacterium]
MKFNPYLFFNGECRAAFEFYRDVFSGRIAMMMTAGESPMKDQIPPDQRDTIMHVRLEVGEQVLMGSDAPPERWQKPQGLAVTINVDDPVEAERLFARLSEDGSIGMPIQETFYAQRFGMCIDRFGTPWMINGGPKQTGA